MTQQLLKGALSAVPLGVIVLRNRFPSLLDSIDLILIGFAVLPWLSSLIHRAELPGGFKIEFQRVQDAGEKIIGRKTEPPEAEAPQLFFLGVAEADPNLALVGLRIELERRIRKLARKCSVNDRLPLMPLFRKLQTEGVLSDSALSGIQELVTFGNQAAHGGQVASGTVSWAMHVGPEILAALDKALAARAD